jgi:S1-C subfamily serine protease
MAATDSELPAIHDRLRNDFEQRWQDTISEFTGDITVKGMVVENGQEFAYASGTLNMASVNGTRLRMKMTALIDPYSGLVYQQVNKVEVSGAPNADVERADELNGTVASFSIDIPSRTPANVTIAEPRKPVTTPSGTGSVVDIYNHSIDAIYEVDTATGTGTAFAISSGQAITAAHVVEGFKTVTLISTSGAQLTARVVKQDSQRDVALLELADAQFPVALNLSRDFAVTGAQVIVIGCPLGACGSVTTGIVSFSARRIQGVALVQIDALINPGNSGGPILNTNGDVIGIVEQKINPDAKFEGLSFGLASPEIVQFLGS